MSVPFPDSCTCKWEDDGDGRPECAVGDTCDCTEHHCTCELIRNEWGIVEEKPGVSCYCEVCGCDGKHVEGQ